MRHGIRCALCLGVIVAAEGINTATAADAKRPELSAVVKPLLNWLPPDTETIIVAQGPFRLRRQKSDGRHEAPSFWESVQTLPLSTLSTLRKGLLWEHLKGKRFLVAVEGSRHFRSPKDLGLLPYQGCQIIRFEENAEDAVVNAFQASLNAAKRTEEIENQQVAVFQEKYEQDDWTILVAQPQPGVLLCATDREYLAGVIRRMDGKPEDRALPDSLPEWERVNTSAAVWGVRHFRKQDADDDPSSPLGSGPSAIGIADGEAVGFAFWYDPSDKQVELRYLSNAADALELMKQRWYEPGYKMEPTIEQTRRGVVRISYRTGPEERRDIFLLLIMAYLGHGVFI